MSSICMYSLIISFHLHLPFISSFTLVCIFMFTYWGVYIQCSTCLPSTSLYLLASLYHIVTWSKFNHVKSCIHSWGHESLWRGDMSQCEIVRIYLTAVPTVHSCHFCHFSLIFPILSIPGHVLVLKSNLLCSFRSKSRSIDFPLIFLSIIYSNFKFLFSQVQPAVP